jgi:hypothetical protein
MPWAEKSKTFPASVAIKKGERVAIGTATTRIEVALSAADVKGIGIAERDAAINDRVAVRLFHDTYEVRAGGAVALAAEVGPAASGQYTTAAATKTGVALSVATAANDIIEIVKFE